jgi:hypothetical protein
MKVIEGKFGMQDKEEVKASDMFQHLADVTDVMEEEGVEIEAVVVIKTEVYGIQVLSNDMTPALAHFLLSKGATALELNELGGEHED